MSYSPTTPNTLYASNFSTLYRTTDRGVNWEVRNTTQFLDRLVVDPTNPDVLYANNFGEISKSTDGGATWNVIDAFRAEAISINPQHSNYLYAATFGNGVRRSTDAGTSWHNYNNGLPNLSCFFVKSATGQPHKLFVATFGSSIYQVDESVTSIKNNSDHVASEFKLLQNYPNPFNPGTTFEFSIPKPAFVTLRIYNVRGEEVTLLVSEKLSAGRYSYNWDAGQLASGVYFYHLDAGEFSSAKKALLLK